MEQAVLEAMPEPDVLRLRAHDGLVLVTAGRRVLYRYQEGDTGMRNLAIVALTDTRYRVDEVAAVFGLSATYVSILRGRAARQGSAGLVPRRGRPPKLTARQVTQARTWAGQGWTQQEIADRLGVSQSVISELLARLGPILVQAELPQDSAPDDEAPTQAGTEDVEQAAPADETQDAPQGEAPAGEAHDGEQTQEGPVVLEGGVQDREPQDREPQDREPQDALPDGEPVVAVPAWSGSARITTGCYRSRYAGAMLLYAYTDRVGAGAIFGTLTGGPARRYDDLGVLTWAMLGFALGAGTVEGFKHLARGQAGPTVGLEVTPELATARSRLGALADGTDPLALQRSFAAGMLTADPAPDPVYFVDDHFVPYTGARPVAKGWNTKRRHAQPGREDTHLVDARGRAVVFGSGEPTGLASSVPEVLTQLREVIGESAPVLLAFDRGGAYPVTFTACRDAGAHWVTYRRAPLVQATAEPEMSSTVRDGKRVAMALADEVVHLKGYGTARQLTLHEDDVPVLQVLTSDTTATGADLVCWLRSRWRIENMFKYAAQHNGIDALACYGMDIGPDPRLVTNPARTVARKAVRDAEAELAGAERALPQLLNSGQSPERLNTALPGAHARIREAQGALADAKAVLRPIPAKVPATDLDPNAKRARPHLARRGLQMVLRLLAFNAEAWLAEHLNTYLTDPDEYRATTRHLLHQGGQIDYTTTTITVTLDRPDSPRIARALTLLTDELNNTPARLPGDPRPLTYHVNPA